MNRTSITPPLDPGRIDAEAFLDTYWQQHPCLIRGWLERPPGPIPKARLATLAGCEELASRLVTGSRAARDWSLEYGPFDPDEVAAMPERNATVLVQDVDKADPEAACLLHRFAFIPHLMLDDIMVSQASPGGSVGPHVDAYDVFLVQVAGTRRWEIARDFDPAVDPDFELALLAEFQPETSMDVEPGEILYLPPGVAHHGVAVEECQTWSVGIRAPSAIELLEALVDGHREALADHPDRPQGRLRAPPADPDQPHRLDPALADQALELVRSLLPVSRTEINRFAGQALTGFRPFEPEEFPDPPDRSAPLALAGHVRRAWVAEHAQERLFIQGQSIGCPAGVARRICQPRPFTAGELDELAGGNCSDSLLAWLEALGVLVNPAPSDRPDG